MPAHELWLAEPAKRHARMRGLRRFGERRLDMHQDGDPRRADIHSPIRPDRRATIWNPKQWGGRIPRAEVSAAWAELNDRYKIERAYCDPGFRDELSWESEIEAWDRAYGPKKFMPWSMSGSSRIGAVYEALRRFEADLTTHRITQDGCPVTRTHMMNARKVAKTLERYGLAKPQQNRKIDAAVTSVLAHEAACDARAAGWGARKHNYMLTGSSTRR